MKRVEQSVIQSIGAKQSFTIRRRKIIKKLIIVYRKPYSKAIGIFLDKRQKIVDISINLLILRKVLLFYLK